jgi:hypothetical protein
MLSKLYATHLHKNLQPFHANWEPDFPIKIGDYGYLKDKIFNKIGNIENDFKEELQERQIVLETTVTDGESVKSFKSDNTVNVSFYAKGELQNIANAALKVSFGKVNGVFFNASGCKYENLNNIRKIGGFLREKYEAGEWKKDYYLITDIVNSNNTILLISEKSTGDIILEATSPLIQQISLADASLELKVNSNNCAGYTFESKKNLKLMFRLAKINETLLGDSSFKPVLKRRASAKTISSAKSNEKIKIGFQRTK